MFRVATLKFLKDLKRNNNKPWFDAHREEYEAAKKDFEIFIRQLIDHHSKKDKSIASLTAKECMFRINRDIRFSKDKSPYKTNFGASINRGGKKSVFGGYYFHLEPGHAFAGGGIWMPMPGELKKIRQEVDYCFDEFKKIISSKKFKSVYGGVDRSDEYKLSRVPKGYDPANPAAEYIKLKSFIALCPIADHELTSKELLKKSSTAFETLQPLVEFINRALEG
jgi:uncharacterized protein (TIGR02453 family)